MQTQCVMINANPQSNIVSTDIYVDPMYCTEPCDVYIEISWANLGDAVAQFIPGMALDGVLTTSSPVTLNGGESITIAFDIPGLSAGTYTIQASPNSGTSPQTVNVASANMASMTGINKLSTTFQVI